MVDQYGDSIKAEFAEPRKDTHLGRRRDGLRGGEGRGERK